MIAAWAILCGVVLGLATAGFLALILLVELDDPYHPFGMGGPEQPDP